MQQTIILKLLDVKESTSASHRKEGYLRFCFEMDKHLVFNPHLPNHKRKWHRLARSFREDGEVEVGGIRLTGDKVQQESWIHMLDRPNDVFKGITRL